MPGASVNLHSNPYQLAAAQDHQIELGAIVRGPSSPACRRAAAMKLRAPGGCVVERRRAKPTSTGGCQAWRASAGRRARRGRTRAGRRGARADVPVDDAESRQGEPGKIATSRVRGRMTGLECVLVVGGRARIGGDGPGFWKSTSVHLRGRGRGGRKDTSDSRRSRRRAARVPGRRACPDDLDVSPSRAQILSPWAALYAQTRGGGA